MFIGPRLAGARNKIRSDAISRAKHLRRRISVIGFIGELVHSGMKKMEHVSQMQCEIILHSELLFKSSRQVANNSKSIYITKKNEEFTEHGEFYSREPA